jgi:hypothetical protein
MRDEYDFSKAVRGKLYRPDAKLNIPVYLEDEIQAFVQEIAEKRKTDYSSVVNQLLRGDMQLLKTMKQLFLSSAFTTPRYDPHLRIRCDAPEGGPRCDRSSKTQLTFYFFYLSAAVSRRGSELFTFLSSPAFSPSPRSRLKASRLHPALCPRIAGQRYRSRACRRCSSASRTGPRTEIP